MTHTLDELETKEFEEDDHDEVPPVDIIAYNELRSCADLYRMYDQDILDIQPEFQRSVVWPGPAQTRFIDSLIKQLPIPSMCFALDHKQQKWMVIDGLQRMSVIVRFLSGDDWRLSKLEDIDKHISGISVAALKQKDSDLHAFFTRVENLSIPITVLRCDFTKRAHMDYLFTIFHRLNTGGLKLTNQEIRNCIYGGTFNSLLKELDEYPPWRRLNKMKKGEAYRFVKQEIILRFFALHDSYMKYSGQLAKFLNDYMHENRYMPDDDISEKRELFKRTIDCFYKKIFEGKTAPKIPITVLQSIMVGIAKNIDALDQAETPQLQAMYAQLKKDDLFSEGALTEGLSKKPQVIDRINRAVEIFSNPT